MEKNHKIEQLPEHAKLLRGMEARQPNRANRDAMPATQSSTVRITRLELEAEHSSPPQFESKPAAIGSWRSELELPRYDGTVLPGAFLSQVEMAAEFEEWTWRDTTIRVALSLEGDDGRPRAGS